VKKIQTKVMYSITTVHRLLGDEPWLLRASFIGLWLYQKRQEKPHFGVSASSFLSRFWLTNYSRMCSFVRSFD
jgi:hypothetical protein